MARIRNTASAKMRGGVGNSSLYLVKGEQIARQRKNNSNFGDDASRTLLQQAHRAKWSNLVHFCSLCKNWMQSAFMFKNILWSDANKLMSMNIKKSLVRLTKEQSDVGACVLEPFIISCGDLTPIFVSKQNDHFKTSIRLGSLIIDENTSVAAFSQAVIFNNKSIEANSQLTFVCFLQSIDAQGVPRLDCSAHSVILDPRAIDKNLRSFIPDLGCCTSEDGFLSTSNELPEGGFSYILSQTIRGRVHTSSQSVILTTEKYFEQYSMQYDQSIKSYGYKNPDFLENLPLDSPFTQIYQRFPQHVTPQPSMIYAVKVSGSEVAVGSFLDSPYGWDRDIPVEIVFQNMDITEPVLVSIITYEGREHMMSRSRVVGNSIVLDWDELFPQLVASISPVMAIGVSWQDEYVMLNFAENP